jgi:hypothetical protein
MKRYVITNGAGGYLHSNKCFYTAVFSGIGINLVVYKNLKSAQKRATQIGAYVLEVENGQRLSEGKLVGIKSKY